MITTDVTCRHCGTGHTLNLGDGVNLAAWQSGTMYVQDAFPHLTADERELLISRTCANCWLMLFGPDE